MTDATELTIEETDLSGVTPENWLCVDCGADTAPGWPSRVEMERNIVAAAKTGNKEITTVTWHDGCEIYSVRDVIWAKAGMEPMGGCLCVSCLEKRLGRRLKPKDFLHDHPFNNTEAPATPRLRKRRKDR